MGPRTATVKRPKAMEMDYMREEMQMTLKGLAAPALIFFVQLFMPQRRHVFLANLGSFAIVISAQFFTAFALKKMSGYTQIKYMHYLNSVVHHTVRTIAHLLYISIDNTDIFGRLFFLYVAPCSAARISSYSTFVGFLVAHLFLLFYRFVGNFSEGLPFLITALACVHILHDTSLLKKRGEETALEKSGEMLTMTEDIAEEVLECFCDATARISPGLDFVQESSSLPALLNRSAHVGRCFTDFMHMGDRDRYREFMQHNIDTADQEEEKYAANDMHEIDHVKGLRLQSIDLHLEDAMNIPLEVHLFHARLKNLYGSPVYLIGISERESYKHMRKKEKAEGPSGRRTKRADLMRLDRLNFDSSGTLAPSRPAFEDHDMRLMTDLEDLQSGSVSVDMSTPLPERRQQRASSPRPAHLEGRLRARSSEQGDSSRLQQRQTLLRDAD